MKILIVNSNETIGGAAIAAKNLHEKLCSKGINSLMLVQRKGSNSSSVLGEGGFLVRVKIKLLRVLNNLLLFKYNKRPGKYPFFTGLIPTSIFKKINKIEPDIVNLHWIANGFLSIKAIGRINRPIVWTLHDSWAFTGGCHLPMDCTRYEESCGSCVQLSSKNKEDLSNYILQLKQTMWREKEINIVCPSDWLASKVRRSKVFAGNRVHVIPNGISREAFWPIAKKDARKSLGLKDDVYYLLFCAVNGVNDPNKGFEDILSAIEILRVRDIAVELLVVGSEDSKNGGAYPITYFGMVSDKTKMREVYSAADLTLLPSKQENLPNSIIESMACATPSVAYSVGGVPEIIVHKENGYIAVSQDIEDLVGGILWVKENQEYASERALRTFNEKYELEICIDRYMKLYQEILEN